MRNLKKMLAVLVAVAIMLTAMSTAFAAAPTVDNSASDTVKTAVAKLSSLGIVNGKEDGKFHEEDSLTRDEFAKMLVVSLNLDNAASAAKGATKFSDVAADRWSSGYVNVAVSKGLILGRPDGTFGPADQVTYAEAVTMLVRALGYKDAWLEGTWPSNMINKADEAGILDDITINNGAANRGDAAAMLTNALTSNMVEQTGFGTDATFEISENTILGSKLDVTEVEGTVTKVPAVDTALDADEIKIDSDTYTVVAEDLDINSLLGKEVTAMLNSDDEVIYASVDTDEDDIVVGTITETDADDDTVTIKTVDGTETEYDISDDFAADTQYENSSATTELEGANLTAGDVGKFGTFILNDDSAISFYNIYDFDATSPLYVSEVDAKYFKGYDAGATQDSETTVKYSNYDSYTVAGAVSSVADITAGDVVYVASYTSGTDDVAYIYVVRNSVAGTLDRTNSDETVVKIEGSNYDVDDTVATFSTDEDDTIAPLEGGDDLGDVIDEEVTAYLDIKGEVRHITTSVDTTSDIIYGQITSVFKNNDGDNVVKVYNPATKASAIYVYDTDEIDGLAENDIVAFDLDSDGAINELVALDSGATGDNVLDDIKGLDEDLDANDAAGISEFDEDTDYMMIDDEKSYIVDDSILMDTTDDDGPAAVAWDDIKANTVPDTAIDAIVVKDDSVVVFIAFTGNYTMSGDNTLAVVTERYNTSDGQKGDFTAYGGDETSLILEDATVTGAAYEISEGDVVVYATNAAGEISKAIVLISGADGTVTDTVEYDDTDATDSEFDVISVDAADVSYSKKTGVVSYTTAVTTDPDDLSFKLTSSVEVKTLTFDEDGFDSMVDSSASEISDDNDIVIITNDDGDPVMVVIIVDDSDED